MRRKNNLFTLLTFIIFFIVSCSGGSSSPSSDLPESSSSPVHPLVWEVVTPSSVSMNENKLKEAFDFAFADGTFTQSAVVIKDGMQKFLPCSCPYRIVKDTLEAFQELT